MALLLVTPAPLPLPPPLLLLPRSSAAESRTKWRRPVFGGGGGGGADKKERKFISREEEPEEYWQTAAEREGRGPMSTVLPYIAIGGLATPFIILAIAFANGWVKIPVR